MKTPLSKTNIIFSFTIRLIIIIIIVSRYEHGYSWPSLYYPLLLADSQGYIPYRHRAAVCNFDLDILPLLVHGKGSTGVPHQFLSIFNWFFFDFILTTIYCNYSNQVESSDAVAVYRLEYDFIISEFKL